MEFEWDETKRLKVLEKHGLDFIDCVAVFYEQHVVIPARSDVEMRFIAVGMLDGRLVAIVFTQRHGKIRLITVRKARHDEQRAYRQLFH